MSTDRELLELAAKAFGFGAPNTGATCWINSEYPFNSGKHGALWNYKGHGKTAELWNPLADDGDAMKLAVKCRILVDPRGALKAATGISTYSYHSAHFDDYGATRRAIVRAAAEIGKVLHEDSHCG